MPHTRHGVSWLTALPFALAVVLFLIGLFGYWFVLADRYRIFLYYHDMGPRVVDTSPLSRVTASRYWMSALVATGAVMVLYGAVNWLAGRVYQHYRPPAWWQVWALSAAPLLMIVPLITMYGNEPKLPVSSAVFVTLAALAGLGLALAPGRMAADRPTDLMLLSLDGTALMLILSALLGLERFGQPTTITGVIYITIAVTSAAGGLFGLLVLSGLRLWRRVTMPERGELIVAGLCVAYLFMPLLHHVGFTGGYYYISDADNFFARSVSLQLAIWFVFVLLVAGITWLRVRLQERRRAHIADSETATRLETRDASSDFH